MSRWRALVLMFLVCACKKETDKSAEDDDDDDKPLAKSARASASTSASAAPAASNPVVPAAAGDYGPTVKIAAGTLRAGSRCHDIPRDRTEELEHDEVSLNDYEIDVYPYPNKAGEPAKLDVTFDEAKRLCEARGKRLCTELEWERACKGEKNFTYPWGEGWTVAHACRDSSDGQLDKRAKCKSPYGVMDMVGLALEWTASDWKRGTHTGDKVLRGARGDQNSWLTTRCAYARKRAPTEKGANVGFRCCSGPANSAEVVLRQTKRDTIDEDPAIDTPFEMTLMKAMPKDHRGITGIELTFDRVYRWHPVPNEEMIVARWKGTRDDNKASFYELAVFKLCGNVAQRVAGMRGPVESIGKPQIGVSPSTLSFDVETGKHRGTVKLSFWYGSVKLHEPDWVKKGNQLKVERGAKRAATRRTPIPMTRPR